MPDPLILTMAAFLTLADQCGHGIAPATLANLQAHESGFQIATININSTNGGTVRGLKTKSQAVAYAKELYKHGVNFDAGIAQINSKNFEWLGVTPESVFDPCEAIKAQAKLLRSYSRYNTGSDRKGFENGYVAKVVAGQPSVRQAMQGVWLTQAQGQSPEAVSQTTNVPRETLPAEVLLDCHKPPAWDVGGSLRPDNQCQPSSPIADNQPKSTSTIRKLKVKEFP